MVVILNNGTRIRISKDNAQNIIRNVMGDTKQWQIQLETGTEGHTLINLSQVAAICKEEDIIELPTK